MYLPDLSSHMLLRSDLKWITDLARPTMYEDISSYCFDDGFTDCSPSCWLVLWQYLLSLILKQNCSNDLITAMFTVSLWF